MGGARAAGAVIGREPAATFWGGYSAVFIDPDGHPWEVAHNPGWTVNADGSVSLGSSPARRRGAHHIRSVVMIPESPPGAAAVPELVRIDPHGPGLTRARNG